MAPLRRYHKGIRRLTEKLLGITFHNMDWFIYCLPKNCGGHGLTNPADKATAAYIGAYISMFSTDLVATTGGVLKPRLLKTFPDLKDLMNDRGDPAESETDRKELKTLWEEHFSTMTIIRRHHVDLLEKVMQIRRAHNPNYVPEFDLDAMLHTPVPLKAACLLSITMWKGPQRIITQAMYRAIFECIIGTSKENKIHLHLGNKSTRDSRNRLKRLLSCWELPRHHRDDAIRKQVIAKLISRASPTGATDHIIPVWCSTHKDNNQFRDRIQDLFTKEKGPYARMIETCPLKSKKGYACGRPFRMGSHAPRCPTTGAIHHTHTALTKILIKVIKSAGCGARIHELHLPGSQKRIEIMAEGVGRGNSTMIDVTAVDETAPSNIDQHGTANGKRLPPTDPEGEPIDHPDPYDYKYYDNGDQDLKTTNLLPTDRVGSYAATNAAEQTKHNHYQPHLHNCDFVVCATTVRGVIGQEFTKFLRKLASIAKKNVEIPAGAFYLDARRRILACMSQQRWEASRCYNDRLPPDLRTLHQRN